MKKIKSFKLFESVEDINDIISTVKDMLLELDFLDIEASCSSPSETMVTSLETLIVIELLKPSLLLPPSYQKVSFNWNDINDVIDNIKDYLESEGFELRRKSPIVLLSKDDGIYTRCEISFVR